MAGAGLAWKVLGGARPCWRHRGAQDRDHDLEGHDRQGAARQPGGARMSPGREAAAWAVLSGVVVAWHGWSRRSRPLSSGASPPASCHRRWRRSRPELAGWRLGYRAAAASGSAGVGAGVAGPRGRRRPGPMADGSGEASPAEPATPSTVTSPCGRRPARRGCSGARDRPRAATTPATSGGPPGHARAPARGRPPQLGRRRWPGLASDRLCRRWPRRGPPSASAAAPSRRPAAEGAACEVSPVADTTTWLRSRFTVTRASSTGRSPRN